MFLLRSLSSAILYNSFQKIYKVAQEVIGFQEISGELFQKVSII